VGSITKLCSGFRQAAILFVPKRPPSHRNNRQRRYASGINMRVLIILILGLVANMASAEIESKFHNPVDRKTYIADWKTYEPEGDVKEQSGRVINSGIRLLSTQADFEKNTTAGELAKLIGFTQELLNHSVQEYSVEGEILLQIELHQDVKPSFKISHQGGLNQELLKQFYDSLSEIELMMKLSTVTLQVHFVVKNA